MLNMNRLEASAWPTVFVYFRDRRQITRTATWLVTMNRYGNIK